MAYSWIFYGIYFLFILQVKKFKFEALKKKMSDEEIDYYSFKEVEGLARQLVEATGSKVNLIGADNIPKESCVFVGNHQGNFDVLIMTGYIGKPIGFIAKKETEKLPGVNYWMRQMHCVFMDREDPRDSVRSIIQGTENLKKGYSMVIYPEGTRSHGREVGEFKKGAMKLATKAGVPIVPVTINGSYKIFESQNGKRTKAAQVDLIVSKPIYTKDLSKEEQNNLSDRIKDIIEENLKKLES